MFCLDILLLWSGMSREKVQGKATKEENIVAIIFVVNKRPKLPINSTPVFSLGSGDFSEIYSLDE